jgi:hypothetical protein
MDGTGLQHDHLSADGIRIAVQPLGGLIAHMTVRDAGREVDMLHRAPWVGTSEAVPLGLDPHLAYLAGDFFCAPFADASADEAPLHGWPANARWNRIAAHGTTGRWLLSRAVMGATLLKELRLHDGHPFLYQRHMFLGGAGDIPAANHAMVSLPNGGHIRLSPKALFATPDAALEPDPARGRHALAYPAQSDDPRRFPGKGGGSVDLTTYPFGPAHEDFVIAIEAAGSPLGWTAVTRPATRDLFLSLRNPRALPMTMLWHSNGGRDYAPWSGRHCGCLGVEEGAASAMLPPLLRYLPAELGGKGGLSLHPDGLTELRHVIGMVDWPSGEPVAAVAQRGGHLTVTGEGGAVRDLAFATGFLHAS